MLMSLFDETQFRWLPALRPARAQRVTSSLLRCPAPTEDSGPGTAVTRAVQPWPELWTLAWPQHGQSAGVTLVSLPRGQILVSTTWLGHPWAHEQCGDKSLATHNPDKCSQIRGREVTWVCMKLEITGGWSRNKTLLTRRWEIMRWLLVQIIHKL